MRFCEFFAGIGGFRLGLQRTGHVCVWASEIAPFPREVYRERFGAAPDAGDLLGVDPASVPASDLWAGAQGGARGGVAGTLHAHHPRNAPDDALVVAFDLAQVTHPENRSRCEPGGPAPTLSAHGRPHVAFVVEPETGQGADFRARPCAVSPTVASTDGARSTDRGVRRAGPLGVRRLTPRECERLQGFPDDWTLVPGASDSRRYQAIGNAVAVPVVEWIGRRLPGGSA